MDDDPQGHRPLREDRISNMKIVQIPTEGKMDQKVRSGP